MKWEVHIIHYLCIQTCSGCREGNWIHMNAWTVSGNHSGIGFLACVCLKMRWACHFKKNSWQNLIPMIKFKFSCENDNFGKLYFGPLELDQIRSDQSLSRVQLFEIPLIAARQASLSMTNSRSSLRLTSIESVASLYLKTLLMRSAATTDLFTVLIILPFPGWHIVRIIQSEKAMAPHSSTLAWKIPWTEEPGGLQSMGSLRVGDDWATLFSLFPFMHWRRKWQPTPVFLPGESQGWGSLVGCRL